MWTSNDQSAALRDLPEPGTRWEIIEKIGSGTFGEVHKARDFTSGGLVAVKIMVCGNEDQELEMELNVLKNHCSPGSSHPNLPVFHGAFIEKSEERFGMDRLWLIMELCQSGAMSHLAKGLEKQERRLSEDIVAYVMKETLKALSFLHAHDIIHRDVKGGNILVTHDAQIKLIDFGVCAELKERDQKRNTSIGTPYWMAPEVIACEHYLESDYDARCDVWSFGITVIELCDAHPPFHDTPVNEAIFKIPRSDPPTVKTPSLWSNGLNDIVKRCLVKNYETRSTIDDLYETEFLRNVPTNVKPVRRQLMATVDIARGGSVVSTMDSSGEEGDDEIDTQRDMTLRSGRQLGDIMVHDLAKLEFLDESSLLHHLSKRYNRNIIYTNIGDILLAINPFQSLDLYDQKTSDMYIQELDDSTLAPHVYTIAGNCYKDMMAHRRNQCCVISGESGSGKTETAKFLVKQFTRLGKAINQNLESGILMANPLFEAFGNASTVMNGNSSRFGKYLMLSFLPTGHIVSAQVSQYLLESSRVVFQAPGERNFHIFYYLYAGLSERSLLQRYQLVNINQHRYLRSSQSEVRQSAETSRAAFKEILKCFDIMAFSEMEVDNVIHILVSVLHIGDIQIRTDNYSNASHGLEASAVANMDKLPVIAFLLGLKTDDIVQAITSNVVTLKGESIVRPNTVAESEDCRDAMAKALYGRLFSWLVNRCNKHLQAKQRPYLEVLEVGILDIFGFEDFKSNGFEQLFINITNEQIQFFFNEHIFAMEQAEYANEGISASTVPFIDNSDCLAMLLQKPLGMLALLDEESRFPKATDNTLIDKFHSHLKESEFYKAPRDNSRCFSIVHYAGKVTYQASSFLEKNRNTLPVKMTEVLFQAGNNLVQQLFDTKLTKTGSLPPQLAGMNLAKRRSSINVLASRQGMRSSASKQPLRSMNTGMTTSRRMQTASWHFTNSLNELLTRMQKAQPHFIRCIKPNNLQQKSNFIVDKVQHQLRYTGVLESIKIRQKGYSHRIVYADFSARYKIIAFPFTQRVAPNRQTCEAIAKKAGLADFALGRTKIFLRYFHMDLLIKERMKFDTAARLIQKVVRGWVARRSYHKNLQLRLISIIKIQSAVRGWLLRRHYRRRKQRLIKAVVGVQAYARGWLMRCKVKRMKARRAAVIILQQRVRAWLVHVHYKTLLAKRKQSAIAIQSGMRKWLACRELRRRREAKRGRDLQRLCSAATVLQKTARRFLARRLLVRLREEHARQVVLLQQLHAEQQRAALVLSRVVRGWLARVKYHRLLQRRQESAVALQRAYRHKKHRAHCRAVVRAKALARTTEVAELERKRQAVLSDLLRVAATSVQQQTSRKASVTYSSTSQVPSGRSEQYLSMPISTQAKEPSDKMPSAIVSVTGPIAVAPARPGSRRTVGESAQLKPTTVRVSEAQAGGDHAATTVTTWNEKREAKLELEVLASTQRDETESARQPPQTHAKPRPAISPSYSEITSGKFPRVQRTPAPDSQVQAEVDRPSQQPDTKLVLVQPSKHGDDITDGSVPRTASKFTPSARSTDKPEPEQLGTGRSSRMIATTANTENGGPPTSQSPVESSTPTAAAATSAPSVRNIRVSQLAAKFNQIWGESTLVAAPPPAAVSRSSRPGKLTKPAIFQVEQKNTDTSFLPMATKVRTKSRMDRKKVGFFEFSFQ